jgi:prolyl-tRNA synthetase
MNQWANVMRWEMRTRLFLRTSEFLWQEGHTAHATEAEAIDEAQSMAKLYADFCRERLAMPVIEGEKTEGERFPGALTTHTIEAMMQDGKALQAGTSHFLGQKFARAFDISFQNKEGEQAYVWTTSWGVSTRLIGALIMTHSDDDGLILPPRIAPLHAVIIPLVRDEAQRDAVMEYCKALQASMQAVAYYGEAVRVRIDDRDERPGQKAWHWVKKGVPVRLEIGMREVESNHVFMGRRDQAYKEKKAVSRDVFLSEWLAILDAMQQGLLARAEQRMSDASVTLENRDDFYAYFKKKQTGFAYAYWCEDAVFEKKLKQDLAVTPRCLPNKSKDQLGPCIFSGKEGRLTLFAKAY